MSSDKFIKYAKDQKETQNTGAIIDKLTVDSPNYKREMKKLAKQSKKYMINPEDILKSMSDDQSNKYIALF